MRRRHHDCRDIVCHLCLGVVTHRGVFVFPKFQVVVFEGQRDRTLEGSPNLSYFLLRSGLISGENLQQLNGWRSHLP